MNSKVKKVDPELFEGQVNGLLTNAKHKLAALNDDISALTLQNENLKEMVRSATETKRETLDTNTQLKEELRQFRSNNDHLTQQKTELNAALTQAKAELAMLIENTERQKSEIQAEIDAMHASEMKLKETRLKERNEFLEAEKVDQRKIELLKQNLANKEHEIRTMKAMLTELVQREAQRENELDQESKLFRTIADTSKSGKF